MCPESHPLALINIGAEFGFAFNGITDPQSLLFSNGNTTSFGFHGDFLQGWTNSSGLQASSSNSFTNDDCPWRQFGTPNGEDGVKTPLFPQILAIYPEGVGLNGPIPTLPGNNPAYTAPRSSGASSSAISSVITSNTPTITSEILGTYHDVAGKFDNNFHSFMPNASCYYCNCYIRLGFGFENHRHRGCSPQAYSVRTFNLASWETYFPRDLYA